jgi:hypothetical protein
MQKREKGKKERKKRNAESEKNVMKTDAEWKKTTQRHENETKR